MYIILAYIVQYICYHGIKCFLGLYRYRYDIGIDADIYNIGIGVHTTIYSDIVHVSFSGQYGD